MMQDGQEPEEMFRNAQFAVKQAKASGRPQLYHPEEASLARRRFSIETELRRALERDQLKLFYQPLIDLKSGRVSPASRRSRAGPMRIAARSPRPNSFRLPKKAG